MKSPDLEAALGELTVLLRCCGEDAKAAWVEQKGGESIREVLAGMGSIGDLYLEPTPECGLSNREVEERQRELIECLDRLTAGPDHRDSPPRMIRVGKSSTDLDAG